MSAALRTLLASIEHVRGSPANLLRPQPLWWKADRLAGFAQRFAALNAQLEGPDDLRRPVLIEPHCNDGAPVQVLVLLALNLPPPDGEQLLDKIGFRERRPNLESPKSARNGKSSRISTNGRGTAVTFHFLTVTTLPSRPPFRGVPASNAAANSQACSGYTVNPIPRKSLSKLRLGIPPRIPVTTT